MKRESANFVSSMIVWIAQKNMCVRLRALQCRAMEELRRQYKSAARARMTHWLHPLMIRLRSESPIPAPKTQLLNTCIPTPGGVGSNMNETSPHRTSFISEGR